MKKIRVRVGVKCFESMRDAARAFGCSYLAMVKRFKSEGQIKNNIMTLDSFELYRKHKKQTKNKRNCPVRCLTTGKEYATITDAAKSIGVNSWTMGLKMEKAGKFIDSNGNEYIRLVPMQTTCDYPDTPARIVKEHTVKSVHKKQNFVTVEKNVSLENALEAIKEAAIAKIKAGSYQEATKYIDALALLK